MFDNLPIGVQVSIVLTGIVAFSVVTAFLILWLEALYIYHHPPLPVIFPPPTATGSMTAAELFSMLSEKPKGAVGVVVASQAHARVVRDALLHYAICSTIRVIYSPDLLRIGGVRVFFITHPQQIMGMQFDLLLVYSVSEHHHFQDGELRVRIKPEAWVKSIVKLREEEQ